MFHLIMFDSRVDAAERRKRRREETSDEGSGEERETEQGRVRGNIGPEGPVGDDGGNVGAAGNAVGGAGGQGNERRDAASSARCEKKVDWGFTNTVGGNFAEITFKELIMCCILTHT